MTEDRPRPVNVDRMQPTPQWIRHLRETVAREPDSPEGRRAARELQRLRAAGWDQ